MALRVWLPLNGNFNNQGIGPQPSLDGTATYGDGKIGQARLTGGAKFTADKSKEIFNDKGFSYCAWIYVQGEEGGAIGSPNCFFGRDGAPRIFAIFQYPKVDDLHISWTQYNDDKSSSIYKAGGTWNDFFNVKTWVHLAITYEPGKIIIYKNGEQYATTTGTPTWSTQPGGYEYETWALTNTPNAYFNDVRVYDECLSAKQIREISKGLVAHYKLEGTGANPNLATNTFTTSPSSFYDYTGKATVSRITDNEVCTSVYKIDFPEDTATYSNYNLYTVIPRDSSAVSQDGKTYTLSFKIKASKNLTNYKLFYEYNNTTIYEDIGTEWKKVVLTGIANNQYSALYVCHTQENRVKINGGSLFIAEIKLELGNKVTDWIPNSNDEIYKNLGYNDMAKKDVSGNGYDLISVDANMFIDMDSSRYRAALRRESATQSIGTIPVIFSLGQEINELTLSGWLKTNASLVNKNLINLGNNKFIRFGPTVTGNLWVYIRMGDINKDLNVASIGTLDDLWHHYVITFKNGIITAYIDGIQKGTADYSSTATSITCAETNNYIGAYNVNQELVSGSVSDIRIYATALSANDVKELYQTSAWIDNKQNIMAYEFKEV